MGFIEQSYLVLANLKLTKQTAKELASLACEFGFKLEEMSPFEQDNLALKLQKLGRLLQLKVERDGNLPAPEATRKSKRLFRATLINHEYEGRGPDILLASISAESAKKLANKFWRDYHNPEFWTPEVRIEEIREVDGLHVKLKK